MAKKTKNQRAAEKGYGTGMEFLTKYEKDQINSFMKTHPQHREGQKRDNDSTDSSSS